QLRMSVGVTQRHVKSITTVAYSNTNQIRWRIFFPNYFTGKFRAVLQMSDKLVKRFSVQDLFIFFGNVFSIAFNLLQKRRKLKFTEKPGQNFFVRLLDCRIPQIEINFNILPDAGQLMA